SAGRSPCSQVALQPGCDTRPHTHRLPDVESRSPTTHAPQPGCPATWLHPFGRPITVQPGCFATWLRYTPAHAPTPDVESRSPTTHAPQPGCPATKLHPFGRAVDVRPG